MTINWTDPLVQLKGRPAHAPSTADRLTSLIVITSSVCSFVALGTTVYRLCVRRGRLWADDAWAFLSMLTLCVQIAAVFMHVPDPSQLSRLNRVAAYYLMATTFYAIIWFARLSILFSIIRLDPSESRRKRLLYIAFLYILVFVFLIAQLFWVCEPEPGWKDMRSPQCTLNKEVAICQLVSDVIADLILIIAPLKLLKGLEDKGLRHRLMVIFSTCIVTTIVSLVHAAYILTLGGTKVVIAALVEDCVSLIVCNIPVVVTASIRLRERTQTRKSTRFSTFITFATGRSRTRKEATFATTGMTMDDLSYSGPDPATKAHHRTTTMQHTEFVDLKLSDLDKVSQSRTETHTAESSFGAV